MAEMKANAMDESEVKPAIEGQPGPSEERAVPKKDSSPRFELTQWKPVANWHYDLFEGFCAICKKENQSLCSTCAVKTHYPGDCGPVTGECDHSYHKHCIDGWLSYSRTSVCPLDGKAWVPRDFMILR